MAKFKEEEIAVFDNDNLTVIRTDPETIKIEGKEVTVMIRDFRKSFVVNVALYLFGAFSGLLLSAIYFLLY